MGEIIRKVEIRLAITYGSDGEPFIRRLDQIGDLIFEQPKENERLYKPNPHFAPGSTIHIPWQAPLTANYVWSENYLLSSYTPLKVKEFTIPKFWRILNEHFETY